MKKIKIFDTTLRDGEQSPGCTMFLHEKLELALQLERLGVDVIEAGFAASSEGDFESVSAIAKAVKNCAVTSLSRSIKSDIDFAYNAVRHSPAPRIHLFLATSPLHMEFKLKKSPEQVLSIIEESVRYAKSLCSDIEFSAEDFARSDIAFAARALEIAIKAGATVINCPDTVGYCTPQEMHDKIVYLFNHVEGIDRVDVSAHNHNDLGLATANSLAMVLAGATQIECTVNGIGERAGNTSLEEVVMALKVRGALYNADTAIKTTELYKTSKMVSRFTGVKVPPSKAIVGENAFSHESGIHQHGFLNNRETYEIMRPEDIGVPTSRLVLGKHSGKHAFVNHLKTLGYELGADEAATCFAQFKLLCDRKKTVCDRDIEAIIGSTTRKQQRSFSLVNYKIKCGKRSKANAALTISKNDSVFEGTSGGDGPVDACYKAINAALGIDYVLDDYSLESVTSGQDAVAEARIVLRLGDNTASGIGASTDIIEASILAYLEACNRLA